MVTYFYLLILLKMIFSKYHKNIQKDVFYDFSERIDEQIRRLQDIVQKDVSSFENLVNEVGIPAIVPKPLV